MTGDSHISHQHRMILIIHEALPLCSSWHTPMEKLITVSFADRDKEEEI